MTAKSKAQVEALKLAIESEQQRVENASGPALRYAFKEPGLTILQEQRPLGGHLGKVYALHWSGNGHNIISASQDGKIIIWNSQTTTKLYLIPPHSSWVMTCAFEQERNEMVACGGLDNLCSIYRIDQGQVMRAMSELAGHDAYLSCCRFVDECSILTTSGDSVSILWDIQQDESIMRFVDHKGDVMSVALDPNSPRLFVTGSCDSTAKLWDSRVPGLPLMTFTGHDSDINSFIFFPDGKIVGTGSDDSTCRIFDFS